jgi:hypothetical protein
MKKAISIALLIPMLVFEVYLCAAFLPLQWQYKLNAAIVRLLPETHDWTPVTHPMLAQEIDQVLGEHVWLKVFLFLITTLLLAVNAWGIYRLIRFLCSGRYARGSA